MRVWGLQFAVLWLVAAAVSGDHGPCQANGPLPKPLGWALNYDPFEYGRDSEPAQDYLRNVAAVAAANETGARLDVVMLGDSITAHAASLYPDAWADAFEGLDALPLGGYGNSVHKLAWRLLFGGEKLALAPRVVIVNIGINDLQNGRTAEQAAERLDWLLGWLAAAWPSADVILQALLPTAVVDVDPANEEWAALAAAYGVTFSTCGAELDPEEPGMYTDAVHPSEQAYRRFLPCLAAEARELLASNRCGLSSAPAPAPASEAMAARSGQRDGTGAAPAPAPGWRAE